MREATVGVLVVAVFEDEVGVGAAVRTMQDLHANGTLTLYAAAVVGQGCSTLCGIRGES